jgi:hypothetical protein
MNKNEILINLSESALTRVGMEEFEQQSLPPKVFSPIWEAESEVNNGGFSKYFLNDSTESASFVGKSVHAVRDGGPTNRIAEVFREACQPDD